jgi:hypothetical protein
MHGRYQSVCFSLDGFCCAPANPSVGGVFFSLISGAIAAIRCVVLASLRNGLLAFGELKTATYLPVLALPTFAFWGRRSYPNPRASVRVVGSVSNIRSFPDLTVLGDFWIATGSIRPGNRLNRTQAAAFLRSYFFLFLPQSDLIHGPIPTNRENSSPGSSSKTNSSGKATPQDGVARAA